MAGCLLGAPATALAAGWQPPETPSSSARAGGNGVGIDAAGNAFGAWSTFFFPPAVVSAERPPAGPWGSEHVNPLVTNPPLPPSNGGIDTAVDDAGRTALVGTRSDDRVVAALGTTGAGLAPAAVISGPGVGARDPSVGSNFESTIATAGTTVAAWSRTDGTAIQTSTRPPAGAFGPPDTVSSPGAVSAQDARVVVDQAGDTVIAWRESDGSHLRVMASVRPAGGAFGAPQTLSPAGHDAFSPGLAIDDAGDAVAVWQTSDGANRIVQAAQRPAGGAFGAPDTLSAPGSDADVPSVGMAPGGAIAVAWTQGGVQESDAQAGGPFSAPQLVGPGGGTSAVAVMDSRAFIVYHASPGGIHKAMATVRDTAGGWQAPVEISPPGEVDVSNPHVAANQRGQAIATWDATVGSSFKVQSAFYDPPPDTTPPTVTSITTPSAGQCLTLDQHVASSFHCADEPGGSGVASCTASVDGGPPFTSGAPVPTDTLGSHLFTVTAHDHAGNVSTPVSHAYAVDPPPYHQLVTGDGPLAYYRLGEHPGAGTMVDDTGQHDGIYQNGVALGFDGAPNCGVAGRATGGCNGNADDPVDDPDTAAQFHGRGAHGYVNGITAPANHFSMEAWVNPRTTGNMMVMQHGGGGALWIAGGHFVFRASPLVGSITGGPAVGTGDWHHVVGTWDGSVQRLYVDGVLVASGPATRGPSGTATFHVGYGDQAPWFHGVLDEVAYYPDALGADEVADHYEVATYHQGPSVPEADADHTLDTTHPDVSIAVPPDHATYQPAKVPSAHYSCSDADGPVDVPSCVGSLPDGAPLDSTPGTHAVTVTATDRAGHSRTVTHTYTVESFSQIIGSDGPLAYWRLDDPDASSVMSDLTGHHHGTYVNDNHSGPPGPTGDGDTTRQFLGHGGYGYVNGITAPEWGWTLEIWVNPDDAGDMMLIQANDVGALFVRHGHFVFRQSDTDVTAPFGPVAHHWYHVVGTWDGIDARLYVDGALVGRAEAPTHPNHAGSTVHVGFGDLAPWARGLLDEAAYFPVALSPERVYQHFLADPPATFRAPGTRGIGTGTTTTTTTTTTPPPRGGGPAHPSPTLSKVTVRGSAVRFTLAAPGRVRATLTRTIRGRILGGTCSASARYGTRCRRTTTAFRRTLTLAAGTGRIALPRRLHRGAYRLTLSTSAGTVVKTFSVR